MSVSFAESYVMHTVESGDTYWKLSTLYHTSTGNLMAMNQSSDEKLAAGDFIKIASLNKNIDLYVDGIKLAPDSSPYLENNRTFVPIRFIADALNVQIEWIASTSTAVIIDGNKKIALPVSSNSVTVNGVKHTIDAPIKLYNDRVYVPLRFVSEILNCRVEWNQQNYSVSIKTAKYLDTTSVAAYSEEDLYWLSRIVSAESSGEPYEGKLAVANVIINRKQHPDYPNTIKGVIFDQEFGYQFTPVKNGTIYNTPTGESIQAAKAALQGINNIGKALYFVNRSTTTQTWIQTNRVYYKTIGNHTFYL